MSTQEIETEEIITVTGTVMAAVTVTVFDTPNTSFCFFQPN